MINPWLPASLIGPVGWAATVAEVVLAVLLIIGYRTEMVAKASGILLLLFALAMTFSTGVKGAFDYSVFSAAAGAFAPAAGAAAASPAAAVVSSVLSPFSAPAIVAIVKSRFLMTGVM